MSITQLRCRVAQGEADTVLSDGSGDGNLQPGLVGNHLESKHCSDLPSSLMAAGFLLEQILKTSHAFC